MADVNELGDIKTLITDSSPADLKALLDQLSADEIKDVLGRLDSSDFPGLLEKVDGSVLERVAQGIGHPSELKQFLELSGGDDAVINAFVSKAGTDVMLDRVFALMGDHFLAEKVGGDSGTVEWHITTPDGEKVYHLTIENGQAEGAGGPAANARTTLTMAGPDLLRLCAGTLDGITAFMHSKIKLSGDMLFGAKLPQAFDTAA
ncbi:SCP2 sterol-binding domain-containing protein [Actinomadura barringtoniae]|uniref:SCP2 sterol-binding domain-containing protein n=1 Tax=Actinomadura barringtoniae TaxID=1427535 RepID=A0A939TDL2_9ACTN|nr:SCP2 sterol-binding domain-containing protein [Actinomadura barringtoniae]MBO2455722.1 SCP2 sterol-binding domain-containing protein [Actinomadura barringtoniae]